MAEALAKPTESVPEQTPRLRLARDTAWSAGASLGFSAGSFISGILVARMFGPTGAGHIAYTVWLTATIGVVASLGTTEAITRYVAELRGAGSDDLAIILARKMILVSLGLTLGGLLATLAVFWIQGERAVATMLLAAWLYVGQRATALTKAALSGERQFRRLSHWTLSGAGAQILVLVVAGKIWGLDGALAAYAIGTVLIAFALRGLLSRSVGAISVPRELVRRIARYSVTNWVAAMASMLVWQRMEFIFLKHYYGPHEVGMFSVGLSLTVLVATVPTYLTGALIPYFATEYGRKGHDAIARVNAEATKLVAALLFPACFIGAALAHPIMITLYGPNFSESAAIAAVMLVAAAVGGTSTVQSAVVHGLDRPWFIAATGVLGVVLLGISGFLLIPKWGGIGAAAGKASAQIVCVAIGTWYVNRVLKCPMPFFQITKIILASGAAGLFSWGCYYKFRGGRTGLLLAALAGGFVYLVACRLLRLWTSDEKALLSRFASAVLGPALPSSRILARVLESL